jgi:hypothetical protein
MVLLLGATASFTGDGIATVVSVSTFWKPTLKTASYQSYIMAVTERLPLAAGFRVSV